MAEPGGSCPSQHIGNDTDWYAVCVLPDYCIVGSIVVPFDSFAVIDNQILASPDVAAQGVPIYRVGDLHQGVLADAGVGVVSGTSLSAGFVRFVSGQWNVQVNGLDVVRHNSQCLVNCNAAGIGGALGRVLTELAAAAPPAEEPSAALQSLLQAEADDRSWWQKTKDFASSAGDGVKRVATASWDNPGDTALGVLKGLGNLPTDLWNLGVLASKHTGPIPPALQADLLERAAIKAYEGGDVATANKLADQGHSLRTSGYANDLFEIKNDAQAGGSFLSMFVPVGAIVKGAGTLGKTARTTQALDATADAARTAAAIDKVSDGVKTTEGVGDAVKTTDAIGDASKASPGVHINHVKAAVGEQVAHDVVKKKKGLEPLGKTDGVYEAGKNGIDGVYKNPHPPPDYVITEAKYGTSPLKKGLADESNQMDDFWVRQRLEEKVGAEQADLIKQAMDEGKVEKWVVRVDENGLRSVKKIDKNGNVILGNKGIVPGF